MKVERRLKRIHFDERLLTHLMAGKIKMKTKLPDDVVFNRAWYDPEICGFSVVIESQEFEPVKEGEVIPFIDPPILWETIPHTKKVFGSR